MSNAPDLTSLLTPHPLMDTLGTDARMLAGYVGRASQAGVIRLYPTLGDPSRYWELAESDVVHVEALPSLSHGGTAVWVRATATVSAFTVRRGEVATLVDDTAPPPAVPGRQRRSLRMNKETLRGLSGMPGGGTTHVFQSGNMDCHTLFPEHCHTPDKTMGFYCIYSIHCETADC